MADVSGKISHRPSRGLWAPGNYSCQCSNCGDPFIGFKRAVHCADCAYSMTVATPLPPPETDVVGEGPGFEPKVRARRCETCEYWGPTLNDTFTGKCRRRPPNPGGGWTRTTSMDWCGEWAVKMWGDEKPPRLTREPDFGREPPLERGYGFEEIGIEKPENHQAISAEEFKARAWGAPRTDMPPRGRR